MGLEETKKDNNKLIVILSGISLFIYLCVLVLIKIFVPTFKIVTFVIWAGGGVLFIGFFLLIFRYIYNRDKKLEDNILKQAIQLPKPITFAECERMIEKMFSSPNSSYATYLKKPTRQSVESVEGSRGIVSQVYVHVAESIHLDEDGRRVTYGIIINMHEPDLKRTILKNPSKPELEMAINRSASYPAEAPDTEVTVRENPLLGTSEQTTRTIHRRADDILTKTNKEDLVQQ